MQEAVESAKGLWLGELRTAVADQAAELNRARTPAEDARWGALKRQAKQCVDSGSVAHEGGVAELRAAVEALQATLPSRFTEGAALRRKLAEAEPAWAGIVAGVLQQDAQALGQLPALHREVREFRRSLLRAMRGMPEFLEAWSQVDLEQEWEHQFAVLKHDLANRAKFEKVATQTLRPEALVLPSDRDPADIVLRRTAALLEDLKRLALCAGGAIPNGFTSRSV